MLPRADGTHLRHQQRACLGPATVIDGHFRQRAWERLPSAVLPALASNALLDVRRTQQPEADVVVAVVRRVVVAGGRARVVWIVVPRPAAHHPGHVPGSPTELHSAQQVWLSLAGNAKKRERRYAALSVNSVPANQ
jgi:hypothetical protein